MEGRHTSIPSTRGLIGQLHADTAPVKVVIVSVVDSILSVPRILESDEGIGGGARKGRGDGW